MKVITYSAKTLEKFTNQILIKGFRDLSIDIEQGKLDSRLGSITDAVIFQLHGAPQAEEEDKKIIGLIQESLNDQTDRRKKIIMIHRPDEIQKYTELQDILSVGGFGFVNFGKNYINDDFFPKDVVRKIIPHGFSSKVRNIPSEESPIMIGSHTSWGEMRSIEHTLMLIGEVFKQYRGEKKVFGYIGGTPIGSLQLNKIKEQYKEIIDKYSIILKDAKEFNESASNRTIFVSQDNTQPTAILLSFNVQMYYLGNRVRTGEASGTIYRSISVPVVLEMNGSVDKLKVIKVPYSDIMQIDSIDFVTGAKKIAESIKTGSYRDMILHNLKQADLWNEKHIASEYLKLIKQL